MATKSMLKDVEIKDKKLGHSFAEALDIAATKAVDANSSNDITRKCEELSGERVKEFFAI